MDVTGPGNAFISGNITRLRTLPRRAHQQAGAWTRSHLGILGQVVAPHMASEAETAVRTFVFETTHHAMWAEDVAREQGIVAEVVPAPPEADAKCGLALRTQSDQSAELEAALEREGILYKLLT